MIISASRRTDLPALYAEWFAERIRAGYCTVPNPMNSKQVARVSLRPEDVDAIVFWSRHPRPLFPLLPELDRLGYRYCFLYTITGYGRPVEAHGPPLQRSLQTFVELAAKRPLGSVIWRYDPILLGPAFAADAHLERFERIAKALAGSTRHVVVSFAEVYRKTERRLGALYAWEQEIWRQPAERPEGRELLAGLAAIAKRYGLGIAACAQQQCYEQLGVTKNKCIDNRLLGELFGGTWETRKDQGQRPLCGCIPSKDIGIPDTCTLGCSYCYATRTHALAKRRFGEHDPASPSLWGHFEPTQ